MNVIKPIERRCPDDNTVLRVDFGRPGINPERQAVNPGAKDRLVCDKCHSIYLVADDLSLKCVCGKILSPGYESPDFE